MKKNLTELVFVMDMSGSMGHLTDDTIGGFNSILKEQATKDGEVLVTTYLFNNDSKRLHDRVPIRAVAPMTERDYCAAGCTALIDALGDAIRHIAGIHHSARRSMAGNSSFSQPTSMLWKLPRTMESTPPGL